MRGIKGKEKLGGDMLRVENLSKTYYVELGEIAAVKDVNFQVAAGEVYGLIGLSGAGKSSLIRCLNLLEVPDSGAIYFHDEDLTKVDAATLRTRRKEIGMIFQHFNLFVQKNVFENIAYPLRLEKWSKKDITRRVNELLDYVELSEKAQSYPAELSGGQKQRVAIARALALNPKLILSDEGTSSLDPETTQSILALIKKSVQEFGISAVLITHQMEVAKAICDRIAVMEDGRIIEENTVEELFLHPKHERTRRFIQTLSDELPKEELGVPDHVHSGPLYRLAFQNESVVTPIISQVSRKFNIDVNLLAGSINSIKASEIGYLTVEFLGDPLAIQEAIAWLPEQNVFVEVI